MSLAENVPVFFQDNWLAVLAAFIIAIFGGGGLAALLKTRSEGPKILVDAAQGAVVVQSGVIEDLREQLDQQKKQMAIQKEEMNRQMAQKESEIAELRTHLAEVNSLRTRVRDLENKNEELTNENNYLSIQIKALTRTVRENEERAQNRNGSEKKT